MNREMLIQLYEQFLQGFVSLLVAVLILFVGYIIARLIASGVRRLLERTQIDDRIANAISEGPTQTRWDVEEVVARVVFWLIMLFVLVLVFNSLNLPLVAGPINAFLERVTTEYIPSFIGAGLLLGVAWIVATVLKLLVRRGAALLRVDERLTQHGALQEGEQVSVAQSLATAVFWFVFLVFLPSVLSALGVNEVAAPLQNMFDQAISYIPNILGAGVILLVGWFVARILRQVLTNLLAAVGIDGVGERMGLSGTRTVSQLIGTIAYTFVLLFTIVSALEELAIEAISAPATLMLSTIINAIPNIFGAAVILAVSYYIARLVAGLVSDLLTNIGFNEWPSKIGWQMSGSRTLAELVGYLIIVVTMLFAAVSAAELLGSVFLADMLTTFIAFLGQLIVAIIILSFGIYLANLARDIVLSAGGMQSNFTASLARVSVLILAGAMALRQLGIADDIVNLAFGIMLGALGIAAALAFGLGSRDIAGREVERFVSHLRQDNVENIPE